MSFFYAPDIPPAGSLLQLSREESQHLSKTLRAKEGDTVNILDGQGNIAESIVDSIDRKSVTCKVTSIKKAAEPDSKIHLYLAPPRNSILTSLIKQCVELGVWEITFLDCEYSVSKPKNKNLFLNEITAAAKQSGNPNFPKVNPSLPFKEALNSCDWPMYYGAVPAENCEGAEKNINSDHVSLWIGPEGGFSPEELTLLKAKATGITVSEWILRTETACTSLLSLLTYLMKS